MVGNIPRRIPSHRTETMSVIDTVSSAVGLSSGEPTYECTDCGTAFESASDPGSYWFECPDCGSEEPLGEDG